MGQGSQEGLERTIFEKEGTVHTKSKFWNLKNLSIEDDSCIQKPMERTVLLR